MDLKIVHRIIAGTIFILSLVTYLATISPTLSFWDCGEFIACSYTLSVPHPPGSPLYLLIGNLFSRIPFGDIGWRINLFSAIVSALTIVLLYLSTVRLVRLYRGMEKTSTDAIITYGGSIIGALTFAFTHSHWFNAVEAEVYAISLFFTAMVFYLILRWSDDADNPASDRILLIIAYFIGLAIGIHLLNILAIPAIALIIYFRKSSFSWTSFLAMVGFTVLAIFIIYPGIVKWLPAAFEIGVILPLLIFLTVLYGAFYTLKNQQRILSIALISIFLIILGYSTYGTIFIRSNLSPPIDENNPDTIERFLSYLNREQYGNVGVFPRRWNNDPNYRSESDFFWRYQIDYMYNRYFLWQFVGQEDDFQGASVDFSKFYGLPLLLGLWGLAHHISRDKKRALSVFTLFLMTGYAIIVYVNQDNPQPRERDYAYTGSYYAFAIWIGIGAQGILAYISRKLKKKSVIPLALVSALIFAIVPFNMFAKNFNMHSRAGNFVAWDYSRNILETCEPDGIIFTNGDNDTFPLWYLQEVMGVRKDVNVVNLSLLNTGWYIKQLKHREPKVPITFTDDYIDRYLEQHDLTALRTRYWPKNDPNQLTLIRIPTLDENDAIEWDVPATMHLPTGQGDTGEPNFLRVQDVMIIDIIRANNWQRPIYFAVTVSNSNMLGLNDYLTMEGLAFRLIPEKGQRINPERLKYNLLENYSNYYRNLDNPNINYDDNVHRLLQNYRSAYLQLASNYLQSNNPGTAVYDPSKRPDETVNDFDYLSDHDKVLFILDCMQKYLPEEVVPISSEEITLHIGQLYSDLGRTDELPKRLERLKSKPDLGTDDFMRYGAVYLRWLNDTTSAKEMFYRALDIDNSLQMKLELATAFYQMKMNDDAVKLLNELASQNLPPDLASKVATIYFQLNQLDKAQLLFEDLTLKKPEDGMIIGGLLMVYERQKNYSKAKELLGSWISAHPNDIQAQKRMEGYSDLEQGNLP